MAAILFRRLMEGRPPQILRDVYGRSHLASSLLCILLASSPATLLFRVNLKTPGLHSARVTRGDRNFGSYGSAPRGETEGLDVGVVCSYGGDARDRCGIAPHCPSGPGSPGICAAALGSGERPGPWFRKDPIATFV